jgi:hypothetical protein
MSNPTHMPRIIVGLAALLVISLGYNAVWVTGSPAILEMRCKAHFAEVSAAAIASETRNDWTTAAHLYAYLMQFYPYADNRCDPTADEANWKLPLGALALKLRYRETPEQTSERNQLDLAELRESYVRAVEHSRNEPNALAAARRAAPN